MSFSKSMRVVMSLILVTLVSLSNTVSSKEVVGWVEKVSVHPGGLVLKAKVDSGAQTSSIHCDCQRIIEKDGEKWINFTVTNEKGDAITLERKVLRFVKIKRHFGEKQERAVVKIGICLKNIYKEVEVNVIDRSGLNYSLLIGRNYLAGDFLIDTEAKFTGKPNCKRP
jgi:hypothetical protein